MKDSIQRIFVVIVLVGAGYSLIAPLFPFIALSKQVHEGTVGFIFSAYAVSNILFIPMINKLIGVFGRKRLCLMAIIICAVCTMNFGLLNAVSSRFLFILLASVNMLFEGIGVAILLIMAYSIASSFSNDRNIKANIGSLELAYSIGLSLGPLLASILFYLAGYSFPFVVAALMILSGVLLINRIDIIDEPSDKAANFLRLLFNREILLTFLVIICDMINTSFIFPVFSTHLFNKFGLRVEVTSLFFVFQIVGYCFALKSLTFITESLGNKYTMMLGLLINTVCVLLLCPIFIFPQNIAIVIIGMTFNGFGGVLITVPGMIDLMQTLKDKLNCDEYEANNNASAIYNFAGSLGESLGPLIGGYLTEAINFQSACFTTSLLNIGFFGIFLMVNHHTAQYEYSLKRNKASLGMYEELTEGSNSIKRSFTMSWNKYSLDVDKKESENDNREYLLLDSTR